MSVTDGPVPEAAANPDTKSCESNSILAKASWSSMETQVGSPNSPVTPMADIAENSYSTFDLAESGASETFPMQCSSLSLGAYAMIKGFPCKIVHKSTSKTGKHGHAKVNLVGLDIFTGRKYEDFHPSTHNIEVPNVRKMDYQVCCAAAAFTV